MEPALGAFSRMGPQGYDSSVTPSAAGVARCIFASSCTSWQRRLFACCTPSTRPRRAGKGASRRAGLLVEAVVRLCPRGPTSPHDRVGKGARNQCAAIISCGQATLPAPRGRVRKGRLASATRTNNATPGRKVWLFLLRLVPQRPWRCCSQRFRSRPAHADHQSIRPQRRPTGELTRRVGIINSDSRYR